MKKMKNYLILYFAIFLHLESKAGGPYECGGNGLCSGGNRGGRLNVAKYNTKQQFDAQLLNLKQFTSQNSVAATNSAITITQAEFQTLASAGNTWMSFLTDNEQITMNVGIANNSSPQSWTLPSNINNSFEYYIRNDFIAPASIPNYLDLPEGTTHVMKIPFEDDNDYTAANYQYYSVSDSAVMYLGQDYDFDAQSDDDFDTEPDFIFANVPLALNDNYSSTTELFDPNVNGSLYKEDLTVTVDGYGTISTPDGIFNCLRLKYVVNKFARTTISGTFLAEGTETRYQWVSDNGFTFEGTVVSENTTTHQATLSDLVMNKILPTNLLTEITDVKLNNDAKGVTINSNNSDAHPSSILEISSPDKGILIPRIAKANRPANPATGLLVYQVDNTPGFYYFNGTSWRLLDNTEVPPAPGGGAFARISTPSGGLGAGTLTNGTTFIKFDQPRDDFDKLLINIQLEGDCNGVYISNKTREGFEVRELQKGKSNVKFRWKID